MNRWAGFWSIMCLAGGSGAATQSGSARAKLFKPNMQKAFRNHGKRSAELRNHVNPFPRQVVPVQLLLSGLGEAQRAFVQLGYGALSAISGMVRVASRLASRMP